MFNLPLSPLKINAYFIALILGLFFSINFAHAITLTSPNGGEVWGPGSTHTISWSNGNGNVGAFLYESDSVSGGVPDLIIFGNSIDVENGQYDWVIPADLSEGLYYVRLTDAISGDNSDENFSIIGTINSDLVVDSISFSPSKSSYSPDEPITVNVTLKNIGQEDSGIFDVVYTNQTTGKFIASGTGFNSLAPGQTVNHSFGYNKVSGWAELGTNILSAVIDSSNIVDELDETNNTTLKSILVEISESVDHEIILDYKKVDEQLARFVFFRDSSTDYYVYYQTKEDRDNNIPLEKFEWIHLFSTNNWPQGDFYDLLKTKNPDNKFYYGVGGRIVVTPSTEYYYEIRNKSKFVITTGTFTSKPLFDRSTLGYSVLTDYLELDYLNDPHEQDSKNAGFYAALKAKYQSKMDYQLSKIIVDITFYNKATNITLISQHGSQGYWPDFNYSTGPFLTKEEYNCFLVNGENQITVTIKSKETVIDYDTQDNTFTKTLVVNDAEPVKQEQCTIDGKIYSAKLRVVSNIRSGWLVKNNKFAEVFYVDADLELRWIANEVVAVKHFGLYWNQDIKEFDDLNSMGLAFGSDIKESDSSFIPVDPVFTIDDIQSGWLVKNNKFAEVFYVDSDMNLKWIINEEAAVKHFGPDWNQDIKEFDDLSSAGLEFGDRLE